MQEMMPEYEYISSLQDNQFSTKQNWAFVIWIPAYVCSLLIRTYLSLIFVEAWYEYFCLHKLDSRSR